MKRFIYIGMVVAITFITIFAMTSYKVDYGNEIQVNALEYEESVETSNDAGYIFDDFGNDINIIIE